MRQPPLPLILPLLSILFIVILGGGLGVSFILLDKTGLGEWGAIIVGMALVIGVPIVGGLLTMPKRE